MPCVHLRQLYAICQQYDLKVSSSDLVRIVCQQCGVAETCPSMLTAEYDGTHPESAAAPGGPGASQSPPPSE